MLCRRPLLRPFQHFMRRHQATLARGLLQRGSAVVRTDTALRASVLARASQPFGAGVRFLSADDMPEHKVVGLPKLSPTMESGSITTWEVEEGAAFSAGDVLFKVETDKAEMEYEAQDDGVLAKILMPSGGEEMPLGSPVCVTVEEGTDVAAFKDFQADSAPVSIAGAADNSSSPEPPAQAAPMAPPAAAPSSAAAPSASGGRVAISPYAKKLAMDRGLDYSSIKGTGPAGRIIAADVLEFQPSAAQAQPVVAAGGAAQAPVAGGDFADVPVSPTALNLAAKLTHAKQTAPHYFLTVDCDVSELLRMRSELNARLETGEDEASGLTVNDFLVKAAALAIDTVPEVNSEWRAEEGVIRSYGRVDINVFMNSDATGGTVAPCVINAKEEGLMKINEVLAKAMTNIEETGEVPPEMSGNGTFSLVNLGAFGVKAAAPIVNTPQAAIMAVGAIEDRVVPSNHDELGYKVAPVLTVTVSFDHRVVDGAVGAQYLRAVKQLLEEPSALLV